MGVKRGKTPSSSRTTSALYYIISNRKSAMINIGIIFILFKFLVESIIDRGCNFSLKQSKRV